MSASICVPLIAGFRDYDRLPIADRHALVAQTIHEVEAMQGTSHAQQPPRRALPRLGPSYVAVNAASAQPTISSDPAALRMGGRDSIRAGAQQSAHASTSGQGSWEAFPPRLPRRSSRVSGLMDLVGVSSGIDSAHIVSEAQGYGLSNASQQQINNEGSGNEAAGTVGSNVHPISFTSKRFSNIRLMSAYPDASSVPLTGADLRAAQADSWQQNPEAVPSRSAAPLNGLSPTAEHIVKPNSLGPAGVGESELVSAMVGEDEEFSVGSGAFRKLLFPVQGAAQQPSFTLHRQEGHD